MFFHRIDQSPGFYKKQKMINNASNSSHVATDPLAGSGTFTSMTATSGPPTLSTRESTTRSLLPSCSSLHSAAKSGDDLAILDAYLDDRSAINTVDPETGFTPLQTALNGNRQEAVKTLITLGARVHDVRPGCLPENVPLHAASELGNPELLQKVLNLSSDDLNAHDPVSGLTPLAFALRGNHLDAARVLLGAGANPAQANADGSLPLVQAATRGDAAAVQLLLANGASVDHKGGLAVTALQAATGMGHAEMVKLLLANGADVHQVDEKGQTMLFAAIAMRQPSITAILLDHGINTEHADRCGRTALCYAAWFGSVEQGKILLGWGANQNHPGGPWGTPIMNAAKRGHLEFLKLLLPAERQLLDAKDSEGNTALHLAAHEGHDAAVQELIKNGADMRLTNKRGNTPLATATLTGHIATMALLLDAEKDLVQATKNAQGCLDYAVTKKNAALVEFLLQRGNDVDDETRKSAKDPLIAEMLQHASLLKAGQAEDSDAGSPAPLDGSELMDKLLDTAVRNKNANFWPGYMKKHHVSPTLSSALESAAGDAREVWKSLAGGGLKVTPAQQKNWCAGILADVGNTMSRDAPHSKRGLTAATQTMLETIATDKARAMQTAAVAAEQPLRTGMANLLQTCMKAVSEEEFYPMELFQVLSAEHGIYHHVASLIVTAFSDVWARRKSLGDVGLEQAFAKKLSSLKGSRKALQAMNSDTTNAGNQNTVNMLIFRQLDLLQRWIDKSPG